MEYIGYIKYQGPHIQHGLFGAREAATALRGFDEMLRYFLIKEAPELANLKFDLPIKVEEGSWELLTPDAIEHLLYVTAGSGIGFCTLKKYFETAAEIAAKDGIFQTGAAKDARLIFQKAFQMAQWVIKFISHVKGFYKKFTHAKIGENESVKIKNDDGAELTVPLEILKLLDKCPQNLFSDLVSIVSPEQELEIGVKVNDQLETVRISFAERSYFYVEEEKEAILPDLIDGETVTLTGMVTRANESAQSIGFLYQEHVITCKPETGKTLADFKDVLISQNKKHLYVPLMNLTGVVERRTPQGEDKDRIRIFFSQLEPNDVPEEDDGSETPDLFEAKGKAETAPKQESDKTGE